MALQSKSNRRRGWARTASLGILLIATLACTEDERLGPTADAEVVGAPDNTAAATLSGIVFSSAALTVSQVNSVHTGLIETPPRRICCSMLSQLRSKKGRVLIKLAGGDKAYRNADGTFNFTKWKSNVDRFRKIDFRSYISDGTIVGHFLVDEPHFAGRWGDKGICRLRSKRPRSTASSSGRTSTIVSAPANWLASAPLTYVHLDAGWAMFRRRRARRRPTTSTSR